jgi:hypothetical protein
MLRRFSFNKIVSLKPFVSPNLLFSQCFCSNQNYNNPNYYNQNYSHPSSSYHNPNNQPVQFSDKYPNVIPYSAISVVWYLVLGEPLVPMTLMRYCFKEMDTIYLQRVSEVIIALICFWYLTFLLIPFMLLFG